MKIYRISWKWNWCNLSWDELWKWQKRLHLKSGKGKVVFDNVITWLNNDKVTIKGKVNVNWFLERFIDKFLFYKYFTFSQCGQLENKLILHSISPFLFIFLPSSSLPGNFYPLSSSSSFCFCFTFYNCFQSQSTLTLQTFTFPFASSSVTKRSKKLKSFPIFILTLFTSSIHHHL